MADPGKDKEWKGGCNHPEGALTKTRLEARQVKTLPAAQKNPDKEEAAGTNVFFPATG